MSKLSRLLKGKKKKPAPRAPVSAGTGIPLVPKAPAVHYDEPPATLEALQERYAPQAPLVNPIPYPPGEMAVWGQPGPFAGHPPAAAPAPSADHQQYTIGNAEYASRLRALFDLTGPSEFALASEIVPVAAFLVGGADSGVSWYAFAEMTPAAGNFPWAVLEYTGPGELHIDRLRIRHTSKVAMSDNAPALILDNAVPVLALENVIPAVNIRAQSTGGGIFDTYILRGTGELLERPTDIQFGLVLRAGGRLRMYGAGTGNILQVQFWGREVT